MNTLNLHSIPLNTHTHTHNLLKCGGEQGIQFQLHADNISIYLSKLTRTMHVTTYISQVILKFFVSLKLFIREHSELCNPQGKGYFYS